MRRFLPLLALFLTVSVQAQQVAGDWRGTIGVPGNPLAIEVTLAEEGGEWSGRISIPIQNLRDFGLSGVRVAGDSIFFRMDGVPGTPTFRGAVQEGGDEIAGDFLQGGGRLTFHLTRAAVAREAAALSAQEALDGYDSRVTAAMEAWKVPGTAIAIVQGDSIIYLRGFGLRDVAENAPVTPETRFAIGSATKAFTATTLAILGDEGKLDWEKPVSDYLPEFRLKDPVATQQMTAVDLLTHRSGLPRHDLLWYVTPFSREELIRRLRYLDPSKPFRSAWQYQNLMYMTAGYLAGHLAGTSWEDLVQTRILDPLGMTGASFSISDLTATADHATGYGGDLDSISVMPYHALESIGPAGSINASARDMAQWVRLQLSDGEVGGRRIVSETNLDFLHTPQVFIAPNGQEASPYLLYTPGWFAEVYRGHRMLQHGGNIDGFSALVGFLPDDDLGLVILTNKNGSPLPRRLMLSAFDRLLGLEETDWLAQNRPSEQAADSLDGIVQADRDAQRVPNTVPSHSLADYAGEYVHPAYGTLTIGQQNGGLRVHYYELDTPLEHWHYDTFEMSGTMAKGTKLTFQTDVDGLVSSLALPLEPSVDPVVFERKAPEVDVEALAQYAGRYRLEGLTMTVAVRGRDLALTVPGQPTYTLDATPQPHTFELKTLSGYRARFEMEGDRVVAMVLLQPNGVFRAERME